MAAVTRKRRPEKGLERPNKKAKFKNRTVVAKGTLRNEIISANELVWNEVPVAGLEDAEGFFGLEELSDVEIARDGNSGKVVYKPSLQKPEGIIVDKESTQNKIYRSIDATRKHSPESEDSWVGLEDSADNEHSHVPSLDERIHVSKPDVKAKKLRKQQKDFREFKKTPNPASSNAFEALGSAEEDENIASEGDLSAWNSLTLSPWTLSALARMKFTKPTPIQLSTIPEILHGHDVIGKAPTGSGKTLAFGIPIYEHCLKTSQGPPIDSQAKQNAQRPDPVALILSPTRELAHQLSTHLTDLCASSNGPTVPIVTLTGGLSSHKQQRLLAVAQIIVATPGRLWELISESSTLTASLKKVKFLVVDEADRLLSGGHFKEVSEILGALDRYVEDIADDQPAQGNSDPSVSHQRQTLVFSATFEKDLQQKLAGRGKLSRNVALGAEESMQYLFQKLNFREETPKFVDVNPTSQMAMGLKEGIVECAGMEKDLYLYSLLLHHSQMRILVFANSISSVRRLTPFLRNLNLQAYALHSQMPQKARLRSLENFSSLSTKSSILIATDVAARGLDIPSVQLVIHYHLPRFADMYVHRSGRTARAESSGSSILLCAPEEVQGVRRLVAKVHARNNTASDNTNSKKNSLRTMELDRRVIARLKPRATLSKKITDAGLSKEKKSHETNWLKSAAEDLGVDYDSEEFAAGEGNKKRRGQGRKRKEKEARELTKADLAVLKAELRELLGQRVNVGVSERYLTAGGIDVDELLQGGVTGQFLGSSKVLVDDL